VLRVVAFNPVEGSSRDASEDNARELERRIAAEGREISVALKDFVGGPAWPLDRRGVGASIPVLKH
jgi:hypothetical protein